MAIELASQEQIDEVSRALSQAISEVNHGSDPSEAIAKYAHENGMTQEFAQRMVESYNAARFIKHAQENKGADRAASFELAHPDRVLELMYTAGTAKQASQARPTSALSLRDFRVLPTVSTVEKAASINDDLEAPAAKPEPGPQEKFAQAVETLKALDQYGRDLAVAAQDYIDAAGVTRDKLAAELSRSEFTFNDIEATLMQADGDTPFVKAALDAVWSDELLWAGHTRAEKAAKFEDGPEEATAYKLASEYIKGLRAAVIAENTVNTFKKLAGEELTKLAQELKSPVFDKLAAGIPFDTGGARDDDDDDDASGKDKKKDKGPGIMDLFGAGMTGATAFGPSILTSGTPASVKPISDPGYEAELRSIGVQSLVNDLISNDPVIRAYPREDVFNAYNKLSLTMPQLASDPLVLKGQLARMLQTGDSLEANELKTLVETEARRRGLGGELFATGK